MPRLLTCKPSVSGFESRSSWMKRLGEICPTRALITSPGPWHMNKGQMHGTRFTASSRIPDLKAQLPEYKYSCAPRSFRLNIIRQSTSQRKLTEWKNIYDAVLCHRMKHDHCNEVPRDVTHNSLLVLSVQYCARCAHTHLFLNQSEVESKHDWNYI